MKSKVAGINHINNKTHIRIKNDNTTNKNYNRFKQELIEKFKLSKKGYSGYTEIIGKSIDINVFKGDDYIHLVIYVNQKLKKKILKIFFKYFEFLEYLG